MKDGDDSLRRKIVARMLGGSRALPTSAVGRIGRTAKVALRLRSLLARTKDGEPDVEALVAIASALGELKGVAMKVGQIMSYIDIALPDDVRAALAALQTSSPPMPFDALEAIVREELGERASALLATMDRVPIAAASIGQVHRAEADGTPVAVKVRYAKVDAAIAADFRFAEVANVIVPLVYPGSDPRAMMEELRMRFLEECDYAHEAASQARFGVLFEDHPTLLVPAVHRAFSSSRVLTTTWIDGDDFETFLGRGPAQAERDRVGVALFEFYVGTLFRHGIYNCDPHPGNYLFMRDGRVAMLDYGCTRTFTKDFVEKLRRLTDAVHDDRREALHASLVELGMVEQGRRYDYDSTRSLMRAFYGPTLHDRVDTVKLDEMRDLRGVYESKRKLMKLSLPGELLFLFRIRFGLMSVLARLGARANWHRLERALLSSTRVENANCVTGI